MNGARLQFFQEAAVNARVYCATTLLSGAEAADERCADKCRLSQAGPTLFITSGMDCSLK